MYTLQHILSVCSSFFSYAFVLIVSIKLYYGVRHAYSKLCFIDSVVSNSNTNRT
ncbi:hypothetical protein [Bacillus phage FI_KG-Lek]|nr:hypothetical protein [Bacillus phage FI_KG-Lek]